MHRASREIAPERRHQHINAGPRSPPTRSHELRSPARRLRQGPDWYLGHDYLRHKTGFALSPPHRPAPIWSAPGKRPIDIQVRAGGGGAEPKARGTDRCKLLRAGRGGVRRTHLDHHLSFKEKHRFYRRTSIAPPSIDRPLSARSLPPNLKTPVLIPLNLSTYPVTDAVHYTCFRANFCRFPIRRSIP